MYLLLVSFVFYLLPAVVESQRPVFPLIPIDGSSAHKLIDSASTANSSSLVNETISLLTNGTGDSSTTTTVANTTVLVTSSAAPVATDRPASATAPKGVYVKTSANEKQCVHHWDCYNLREPDEWCPLGATERFLDKGCFCDLTRNLCTIQRLSENGAQYSDCADKSSSACSGLGNNIVALRLQRNRGRGNK